MPAPITCLDKKTMITMADYSQKPFGEVKNGDMILSFNFENGKNEPSEIIEKYDSLKPRGIEMIFEDRIIIATQDHPFYSTELGWVSYNPYQSELYYKNLQQVCEMRLNSPLKQLDKEPATLKGLVLLIGKFEMCHIKTLTKNMTYYANGLLTVTE